VEAVGIAICSGLLARPDFAQQDRNSVVVAVNPYQIEPTILVEVGGADGERTISCWKRQ